jgi:UDP-N-acetylmuramyl pentapeptide synthase
MKSILKSIVASILGFAAHVVVRRYAPTIVMVTGSVGKTSTKEAVAAVLSTRFFVRKSEKSYNSEFGVPFTIFGVENPWGSLLGWGNVLKEMLELLLLPNHYPKMLVLEVGADKPGDLAKILRIATPHAVVVTHLPAIPVHVEAYTSPEEVREEEFSPAYALPGGAPLIVSSNDPFAMEMAVRTPSHVSSFGEDADSTVRITHIEFHKTDGVVDGMQASVHTVDATGTVVVKGTLGRAQLLSSAAAIAVGNAFGISLTDALLGLEKFSPPPGRGKLLRGIHETLLIDESYNSSPAAVEEALNNLRALPGKGRRIAVLGDMLELGRYSVKEHDRIGTLASRAADIVIGVGVRASRFVEAARQAGKTEATAFTFEDSHSAAKALPALLTKGDIVLVKGSQSIRTERILEALLQNPGDAKELVRQDAEWKRRA